MAVDGKVDMSGWRYNSDQGQTWCQLMGGSTGTETRPVPFSVLGHSPQTLMSFFGLQSKIHCLVLETRVQKMYSPMEKMYGIFTFLNLTVALYNMVVLSFPYLSCLYVIVPVLLV